MEEAKSAGEALKKAQMKFDIAHTSVLTRANKTLDMILDILGQKEIPVKKSWRLNERHYGGLTGLNKAETAAKHGEEQVRRQLGLSDGESGSVNRGRISGVSY